MSSEADAAPWGQASFENERNWYGHLPSFNSWEGDLKAEYREERHKALTDPNYDLFEHFMPTGKPKRDIGSYVARHGVPVPLIRSMDEWQHALLTGNGMLRSEMVQDYNGVSGLLRSSRIELRETYPRDENGRPEPAPYWDERMHEWVGQRRIEGPAEACLELGRISFIEGNGFRDFTDAIGNTAVQSLFRDTITDGLAKGTINPAKIMQLTYWQHDLESLHDDANLHRYPFNGINLDRVGVSRWRYVPGVNVRIFRDPVIEGRYFIGGRDAHHEWEILGGRDSPDLEAHNKSVYRGRRAPDEPEYTLPTRQLVDLYEKVRTLPYFDQNQTPLLELQYGEDGILYFLQYLKTGLRIGDPGEFALPTGDNVVTIDEVRGATTPAGEDVRIYIDPKKFTLRMQNQAFVTGYNMQSRFSNVEQIASIMSRVMILDSGLNFKDNHSSSSPLYRAPVAMSLWDSTEDAEGRFKALQRHIPDRAEHVPVRSAHYINAAITSNGRRATIESDWDLKTEELN